MTRLELMQLSQGLSDLYTGMETDLLANIAAFLTAEQADMPSAQWKIQMLAQLGALDRKNLRTITQYVKNVPRMLQDTLQAGVLSALEDLEPGFRQMVLDGILHGTDTPVEDTMARALKAYARQARKSMNMVNTVMRYKARDAAHKAINDTAELADKQEFLNALNKAAGKTVSGIESRQAAMRQCIKEMTDKGIPAFVDKRGREWSPEAYVNMAIRTTAANTAQQAQFDRMDDYGLNLVEVSSHSGARPKCAKDQGKIFNRSGGGGYTTDLHGRKIRYYAWSESSYGEPDGILGINCGHQIYPFTPGVSYQTYFPEPEEENAEAYKKSQQQRELERRVRKSKRECMMLETAGDPEGARQAQQLLKQRQDALRQFCGDNGLRYKPDRTAVADYKKSVAGYVPPDQTERIRKLNGLDVDKTGGSGIIKTRSGNMSLEYQRYGRNKSTLVNKTYIDGGEYRRKFNNATDNPDVNKSLYNCSKEALKHCSGTVYEDMYWLDSKSGNVLLSITDSTDERAIVYTEKIKRAISGRSDIITIHTHPSSMPPSISDLNSCCRNQYKMGFVACHDGRLFSYSSNEIINERIYSAYIERFLKDGYDEFDAQLKALEKLSQNFDIKVQEVFDHE